MKAPIRQLLFVLLSNLDSETRVRMLSKIPKKQGALLNGHLPEDKQLKIIESQLGVNANAEFILRQLTNKKFDYLIKNGTYGREIFDSLASLKDYVKCLNHNYFSELLIYMFGNMDLNSIENLFPSSAVVEEVLNLLDDSLSNEYLEENQKSIEKAQYTKQIELLNKKIESSNEQIHNMKLLINKKDKFAQKLKNEKEIAYRKLKEEQEINQELLIKLKDSNSSIDELQKKINKKSVLLIANKNMKLKDTDKIRFTLTSEEEGLANIVAYVNTHSINTIWALREYVSGFFIHKLKMTLKYTLIEIISIEKLMNT